MSAAILIARSCLGYFSEDEDLKVRDDITDREIEEALEFSSVSWEDELSFAMSKISDAIHDSDLVEDA